MSSITSLSASTAASQYVSSTTSSTSELSEETKAKLRALGIDPSTVTSETEAQLLIAQAQQASESKTEDGESSSNSELALIQSAQELAAKVGVQLSQTDTLDEMCSKIAAKIEQLSVKCAAEGSNMSTIQAYLAELSTITSQASNIQTSQNSMFAAMNMISVSNKYALGLS